MYILYIIVLKIKLITSLHALSVAIHLLSNNDTYPLLGSFKCYVSQCLRGGGGIGRISGGNFVVDISM